MLVPVNKVGRGAWGGGGSAEHPFSSNVRYMECAMAWALGVAVSSMTRPAELASFSVAHCNSALGCIILVTH